jgi:hypothetical protein
VRQSFRVTSSHDTTAALAPGESEVFTVAYEPAAPGVVPPPLTTHRCS